MNGNISSLINQYAALTHQKPRPMKRVFQACSQEQKDQTRRELEKAVTALVLRAQTRARIDKTRGVRKLTLDDGVTQILWFDGSYADKPMFCFRANGRVWAEENWADDVVFNNYWDIAVEDEIPQSEYKRIPELLK